VQCINILVPVIRATQVIDIGEKKFEFEYEVGILVSAAFHDWNLASENDGVMQFCLFFAVADQECL